MMPRLKDLLLQPLELLAVLGLSIVLVTGLSIGALCSFWMVSDVSSCMVDAELVGPLVFVGTMGGVPGLLVLFQRCKTSRHYYEFGSVGGHGREHEDEKDSYVRPSLFMRRQMDRKPDRNTVGRKMLCVAQFLSSTCNSSWDFVFAVAGMQLFVDTLYPMAVLVIFGCLSSSVLGARLANCLRGLNRFNAISSLLVVERMCFISCLLLLIQMFWILQPELFEGAPFHQTSQFVTGLNMKKKPDSASSSPPVGSGDGGNDDSAASFVSPKKFDPWIFFHGQSPDVNLNGVFTRTPPEWTPPLRFNVSLIVLFYALGATCRTARVSLIRKDWIKKIAASPFATYYTASDVGSIDQPVTRFGGSNMHNISSLGSLTASDDSFENDMEIRDIQEEEEEEANCGSGNIHEDYTTNVPEVAYDANLEFKDGTSRASNQILSSYRLLKVELVRVQTMAYMTGPLLLGFIFDLGDRPNVGAVMAISSTLIFQVCSAFLEMVCFRLTYISDRMLQEAPPAGFDGNVNFFDPYGNRSIYHPIGVTPSRPWFENVKRFLRGVKIFIKNPAFLASLSYSLMFATILDCGLISLAYLRWRRLPAWMLGLLVALRCLTCGLVSFAKYVHRCTGSLARTASCTIWGIWCSVFPVVIAMALFGVESRIFVIVLLAVILVSGPIMRAFSLIHSKLIHEWVEEQALQPVLDGENLTKVSMVVLIHLFAMANDRPEDYHVLVFLSTAFCFFGVVLFTLWYRLYDSGTPFQVVDEIGQIKLVVRG